MSTAPGIRRGQIAPIPSIDGQLADLSVLHHAAKRGRVSREIGFGDHLNRLPDGGQLKGEVQRSGLADGELDIRTNGPEAGFFGVNYRRRRPASR